MGIKRSTAALPLRAILAELVEITPEGLRRTEELGPKFDFSPGIKIFDQTLRLFRSLADSNLDNVPWQMLATLKLKQFRAVQAFDASGSSPAQTRDQLIEEIAGQYHSFFAQIGPVVAYSVRKGTDFEKLEEQAREAHSEIERLRGQIETRVGAIVKDANAALESVRKVALEAGVAQHYVHFKDEAERHRKARTVWLWVTGILAVALVIAGVAMVRHYIIGSVSLSTAQAIQLGIAKLVLFGVLYFALIWASRIYRAESHNLVVNRHRQNALSTFEAFVKATGDEQTKNAVLLQATHSIFQHQVSGFATHEAEGPTSPQVLEIIRGTITPSKPPGT